MIIRTDKLSYVERGMEMKKVITNNVIKKIAKMEGIGVKKVREDMRLAIQSAYENPEFVNRWNDIFGEGHQPSPEEFMTKILSEVERESEILLK